MKILSNKYFLVILQYLYTLGFVEFLRKELGFTLPRTGKERRLFT